MLTIRNACIVLILSRLVVIFGYDAYLTDVHFYFEVATAGIKNNQMAFKDFLWGYPPLSLLTVYLPYVLGATTFGSYRTVYQLTNFFFELLTFWTLIKIIIGQLKVERRVAAKSLLVYCFLGLFVGHLIYDRVDFFIIYCFVAALYLARRQTLEQSQIMAALGTLWKVIPALWWPVYGLALLKLRGRKALKPTLIFFGVTTAALVFWNLRTEGGMLDKLTLHSDRGIQVESLWATPYMLAKAFNPNLDIKVENNNGAQHLGGTDVGGATILVSKVIGFLILTVIFGWLIHYLKNLKKFSDDIEITKSVYFFSSLIILSFIATQRVFSTTFIIWLLPIAAIDLALKFTPQRLTLYLAIFVLTFISFDLGYFQYVAFNTTYVLSYTVRNVFVVALFILFAKDHSRYLVHSG